MDISIKDVIDGKFDEIEIIFLSRIPRLLAIILTGIGMSVAGLLMQQLCMNKFMSPSTGSTISSAQFGVLISMLFFANASIFQKTMISFLFAVLGTFVFVYFIQKVQFKNVVMVPLVGIMFGNVIGGITSHLAIKHDLVQSLTSTIIGDFSLVIQGRYEIVYIVLPLIVLAFVFANHFNIVGMGEDFSKNLGLNYKYLLFFGLSISALITASIVSTVGTISYVGLVIPNIVSIFKGDKIRGNLVHTALLGSVFVLLCDIVGRLIIFPYELPIDLVVGVIGSVIFIFIMMYRLKSNSPRKSIPKTEGCGCK